MADSKRPFYKLKKTLFQYARTLLVALGWGTSFGGITLWAVFQGALLPSIRTVPSPEGVFSVSVVVDIFYLGVFGVSVLAGVILEDFARLLGAFIIANLLGLFIVFEALSAPGLSTSTLNSLMLITRNGLTLTAIDLAFRIVVLHFTFFVLLLGSILGTFLAEHYS